jgi:pimeloyl-ACP methyl ester carboxylesterase
MTAMTDLFWKVVTDTLTEPASYVFDWSGGPPGLPSYAIGFILLITGAHTTTPLHAVAAANNNLAVPDNLAIAPDAAVSVSCSLVLRSAHKSSSFGNFSTPSGQTFVAYREITPTPNIETVVTSAPKDGTGAVGSVQFPFPGSGTSHWSTFTIAIQRPGHLAVDFLDPVPDLLENLKQTAEQAKDKLATKVETVNGVATDGVARVVVRATAPEPGTMELTLVDDAGMPLASPEEAGFLTQLGGTAGSNSLFVPTVDVLDKGPMAFAIYRAPTRFVRAGSADSNAKDRQVSLRVGFIPQMGGGGQESTAAIKIARPPVVLVHGLWGSEDSWNRFGPLTTGPGSGPPSDPRFFVRRVDYRETNAASLAVNAPQVLEQIHMIIEEEFKATEKVAAVQADVVSHSMGGLIVRQLALLGNAYFRADNFGSGDVHKLTTIGTMHFGTALARLLRQSTCLSGVFNRAGFRTDQGGVADVVPGNLTLNRLNEAISPMRLHAVVGIASPQQKLDTQTSPVFRTLTVLCVGAIPLEGLDQVFRTPDHDLLVEATSQRGTFAASALTVSTFGPTTNPVIHTRIPNLFVGLPELQSGAIAQRVILLLNGIVESELFEPFEPRP